MSIPYALESGGWLSLIFLFIISIAACYTGLLIKRCMDKDSSIESLPDIGQRAFGEKGRLLVNIAMNYKLYLVITGYLILGGDNLNKLMSHVHVDIGGLTAKDWWNTMFFCYYSSYHLGRYLLL